MKFKNYLPIGLVGIFNTHKNKHKAIEFQSLVAHKAVGSFKLHYTCSNLYFIQDQLPQFCILTHDITDKTCNLFFGFFVLFFGDFLNVGSKGAFNAS